MVEVIAREDEHVIGAHRGLDALERLAHRVGRALEELVAAVGLLRGEELHAAAPEDVEAVRVADVRVERRAVELGEHGDLPEAAVDRVRERDVEEPVLASEGHGGLGPVAREGMEARAAASAQDHRVGALNRRFQLGHGLVLSRFRGCPAILRGEAASLDFGSMEQPAPLPVVRVLVAEDHPLNQQVCGRCRSSAARSTWSRTGSRR
jgi:hypothetical protein